MTREPEEEIPQSERRALQDLKTNPIPPPELEDRVVAALRARGLLSARPASRGRWRRPAAALAASVLIFLGGALWGSRFGPAAPVVTSSSPPSGEQFVLLLYESGDFLPAPPGGDRERVHEYVEWARRIGESGHRVSGEKLEEGGELLGPRDTPPSAIEPAEAGLPGTLAGYFVIDAANDEEIREIASTCPHLRYGGRIVIRRIEAV